MLCYAHIIPPIRENATEKTVADDNDNNNKNGNGATDRWMCLWVISMKHTETRGKKIMENEEEEESVW